MMRLTPRKSTGEFRNASLQVQVGFRGRGTKVRATSSGTLVIGRAAFPHDPQALSVHCTGAMMCMLIGRVAGAPVMLAIPLIIEVMMSVMPAVAVKIVVMPMVMLLPKMMRGEFHAEFRKTS